MSARIGRPPKELPRHEVDAYINGDTATTIASRLGYSRTAVLNGLRRAGVAVRPGGTPRRSPPPPKEPRARTRRAPEERFWSFVVRGEGDCWPWRGGTCKGYGVFSLGRKSRSFRAHRFAWEITRGPIPDGLHVLHRCDNPPCCNPDHLFLGTHIDNVADMVAKGRGAKGERSGARLHPERVARGERNGTAKLTAAQVAEIRATPRKVGSQHALALRFGVSDATISMIVNGKAWATAPAHGGASQ